MISLPAHKAAAESVDSVNDDGQIAAACAYIATAEGTAATMAERACDRAALDYAACPREVLEAADRRAEALAAAEAPAVPPEVQAVLDARVAVAKAERDSALAIHEFTRRPNFGTMDTVKDTERALHNVRKALRTMEAAVYVPGATPYEDSRAFWARRHGLRNEIDAAQLDLSVATKKGQKKAMERHATKIARLKAELAEFDAAHKQYTSPD